MKVCSKCRVKKLLSDFQPDPRYRLGVTGWCKACRAACSKVAKEHVRQMPKIEPPCRRVMSSKNRLR